MPKDPTRPVSRVASISRAVRERARWWRNEDDAIGAAVGRAMESPRIGWGALVTAAFALICSAIVIWSREQPLVAVDRVMDETRLVRVPLSIEDRAATEQEREKARNRTPWVYVADTDTLAEMERSLINLPASIATASGLSEVVPEIRERFGLDANSLAALQAGAQDRGWMEAWAQQVRATMQLVARRPMVDEQTYQRSVNEGLHRSVKLIIGRNPPEIVPRYEVVNAGDERQRRPVVTALANGYGFVEPLRSVVVNRLMDDLRPTFRLDESLTAADGAAASAAVTVEPQRTAAGQILFRRGDVLTQAQFDLYDAELSAYRSQVDAWRLGLRYVALTVLVSGTAIAMALYAGLFTPRIRRNPGRMFGVAGLLLSTLLVSTVGATAQPGLMMVMVVCPAVLSAMILTVAYDQRVALAYGALHGIMTCVALDRGIGEYAVLMTGTAFVVWQLRAVRDRAGLIRASFYTGIGVGVASFISALIDRPLVGANMTRTFQEMGADSALVAAGTVLAGGVTLFILPSVERLFDAATGMTLIELRDPKHPLLRELQQRAPGTYNHSLNVANIAEAAAESVRANSLLTYVGALYHDVGKMNKPEYFVENRSGGQNKHDRLSPAMSLLVIVGHVKDGMELAREFSLPREIQHFIEAHHGTTLVEYFYHRAKEQAGAEGEDAPVPDEVEYRYPGPKPQSKEVAIVMLSDAVESATRTLAEPNPAAIERLVRSIANKRLMDGQFEDCEMTLRDLNTIVESISRTLAAVYHGRILYPDGERGAARDADAKRA
jgi:putative nucleotidyltransferase with HDIG domain